MTQPAERPSPAPVLADLPDDELCAYARDLGLSLHERTHRGEILRLVRQRQELLLDLDRDAMLDVVQWMRWPVRESAGKETLARVISQNKRMDFDGLSDRGLQALARLKGVSFKTTDSRKSVQRAILKTESIGDRFRRRARRFAGRVIDRAIGAPDPEANQQEYQFLPEDSGSSELKRHIENEGVVGGIARRLRGVADDYVREKLDEIELRIDRKLDEIDLRLAEWRDREVTNRLKILKLTLVGTILVALISLGYHYWVK